MAFRRVLPSGPQRCLVVRANLASANCEAVINLVDWPKGARPGKLTKKSLQALGVRFNSCTGLQPHAHHQARRCHVF